MTLQRLFLYCARIFPVSDLITATSRSALQFSVGDGIAVIDGLHDVTYGEIVLFDCGIKRHGPGHPHGRNNRRCSVRQRQRNHRRYTRRSHTPHCRHSDKQPHPRKNDKPARQIIDGGDEIGAKEYFPLERPSLPAFLNANPCSPS